MTRPLTEADVARLEALASGLPPGPVEAWPGREYAAPATFSAWLQGETSGVVWPVAPRGTAIGPHGEPTRWTAVFADPLEQAWYVAARAALPALCAAWRAQGAVVEAARAVRRSWRERYLGRFWYRDEEIRLADAVDTLDGAEAEATR